MQNLGIVPQRFEILLRLSVFQLTYLSLCKAKPSSEKFLIECLAEQLEMARMVPVRLKYFANVLTPKCGPELVRLEELVPELGRWRAELITLLPVAPTAQARAVIRSERCSTALTATSRSRTGRASPLWTGSAHL
jgi:hypothetical protein